MNELLLALGFLVLILVSIRDYQASPMCRWCQARHRGRCMYNPRAGRVVANAHDGHFDYDDPNR